MSRLGHTTDTRPLETVSYLNLFCCVASSCWSFSLRSGEFTILGRPPPEFFLPVRRDDSSSGAMLPFSVFPPFCNTPRIDKSHSKVSKQGRLFAQLRLLLHFYLIFVLFCLSLLSLLGPPPLTSLRLASVQPCRSPPAPNFPSISRTAWEVLACSSVRAVPLK